MNRNKNINYTLNKINEAWKKKVAAEMEGAKYETRLAKLVIGWLYRHNRKALTNLDRSDFGMLVHSASLDTKSHTIIAKLWYSRKNEDGSESSWYETHKVTLADLRES
jgi:hypothetical protein